MCGIFGMIGRGDNTQLEAMNRAIAHRGPDDHGFHTLGDIRLGHRRLSIIDLSAAGKQPMRYGSLWITYNGEIYNYLELRSDLQALGHQFSNDTDTEVIMAAYQQWGVDCLQYFRGMFSFAIYDQDAGRTFLARDRFGIKPLYYAACSDTFIFASELKAMLASGHISRQVDRQALWHFFSLGSIPQPNTILQDVKSLPPGSFILLEEDAAPCLQRYWDIAEAAPQNYPHAAQLGWADAVQQLRGLLDEATHYHLIADVPVGAFLSGGVDSTAVVGLMNQYVNEPIKTYSIGFADPRYDDINELRWAKQAAELFNTDHTELLLTDDDVAQSYDRLVHAIDQPSLDGTNSFFVSQITSQHVKVALSGLGGDELFAGYPQFLHFQKAAKLALPAMPGLVRSIPIRALPDGIRQPLQIALSSSVEQQQSLVRNLASEAEKQQMLQSSIFAAPLTDLYHNWLRSELDVVSQLSYVELSGYMANTLLRDTDAMSMAHSLEVRPVLLDHKLAEFAFALPSEYKVNGNSTKKILIEALRDIVPNDIANRPKRGFTMPLSRWLTTSLQKQALDSFTNDTATSIFSAGFLKQTQAQLRGGKSVNPRLWAYMMLINWLDANACYV